ncbi:hypothetical protein Dimus_014310 [Dionaea muscipula]
MPLILIRYCIYRTESIMAEKPHVVCVPSPAQGHINPMLMLAKLLHVKGFHVTFVNTEYSHNRLLQLQGPHSLDGLASFRFEAIPDGLPPAKEEDEVTHEVLALGISMEMTCSVPFRELIARLNDTASSGVPPVTSIISDATFTFTFDAADEFGIQKIILWPASASAFLAFANFHTLSDKGIVPFKDSSCFNNGYMDTVIDWIPGMEGITLRHLPSFVRTTDADDFIFNNTITRMERIRQTASAIIFNTFTPLEEDAIASLSRDFPPLYPIGPLHLLIPQIKHHETPSMGSNLWKEDPRCLQWLDRKAPGSVVYVNFGSITMMTPTELVEFSWGLANSKHYFLWIIRPGLVSGASAILPAELVEETKHRGLLASWCDQEGVLSHKAIGVFLTHSGWNSTLESICAGVPMICWPFFADQQTNCWFCSQRLGIGIEIGTEVRREVVERQVRELMEGDKGKEMRSKAMEWKRMAKEAATWSSGSSHINLDRLIRNHLSL